MVRSLLGLNTVADGVGNDPEVIRANARYRAALLAILGTAALLMLACLVVISIGVIRLNKVNDAATEQRALILSCTTPGGDCYEQGQKQTADVVKKLVKADNEISKDDTARILRAIRSIFPVAK